MKKNILIGVLVVGVAVLAYFVWRNWPAQKQMSQIQGQFTEVRDQSQSVSPQMTVQWKAPTQVASLPNFLVEPFPTYLNKADLKAYDVGTFSGGIYDKGEIYLVNMPCDGMCEGVSYRIVSDKGAYHILTQNSELSNEIKGHFAEYGFNAATVSIDSTTVLPGLSLPATLSDPAHHATFTKVSDGASQWPSIIFFNLTDIKLVFTDPIAGNVYTTASPHGFSGSGDYSQFDSNGFYVRLPDGTTGIYMLDLPFYGDGTKPASVTWSDGTANTRQYSDTDRTGCGSRNYLSIVSPGRVTMADLIQVGKTSNGEAVYGFKDNQNTYYKQLLQGAYMMDGSGQPVTSDYYFSRHPFFFWVDQYGDLVKFTSSEVQPAAECGKPVIYLYPTKETKVSVNLAPVGGFTYTEPAYNSGWNVLAEPNGAMTNLLDSKAYPYLFWEGRGGIYQTPDKGWSVAQKDVSSFLDDKLSALGLNSKEVADFKEFWLPKMQGSPYYFVTFMGNQTMDQIAPLNIAPKPDTVIRILMDFKPLDKPIDVEGFAIRTPERKGFTVVEWGGVLRK